MLTIQVVQRYYSDSVLSCLHRKMAIQVWLDVKKGKKVRLEKVLTAFDMCILGDREGDFDEVCHLMSYVDWLSPCRHN